MNLQKPLFKGEKSGNGRRSLRCSYPAFPTMDKLCSRPSERHLRFCNITQPNPNSAAIHGSNLSCVMSALGQAAVSKGQSQLKISKQATQFCLVLPFKYNFSSLELELFHHK